MRKGFTLIELLVVITIILVVSGIGLVTYTGAQTRARDTKRKADLEQIRSVLEMYRDVNDLYPDALSNLTADGYLDSIPDDPKNYDYYYNPAATRYTYQLCAYLESGNGGCDGNPSCGSETCNYQVRNP